MSIESQPRFFEQNGQMKITLKDTKPYPIWLAEDGCFSNYYRVTLPARMTGGRVNHTVQIMHDGRSSTVDLFDEEQCKWFATLPEVTMLGLGTPTVIPVGQIFKRRPSWLRILGGLRDCGARIFLESDDDLWCFYSPENLSKLFKTELEKRRISIVEQVKESLLFSGLFGIGERDIAAIVESRLQKIAAETSVAALSEWAALIGLATPICSTERLRNVILRHGAETVAVAPNVIDPADFQSTPRMGDIVRVGYAGTQTHKRDMHLVIPTLLELSKLPHVEIVFFGFHPLFHETRVLGKYVSEGLRYTYGGHLDFHEFCRQIGVLDISLAPLLDTPLNASKSPQKWFEASMNRTALVLSDSPVYDCVEHGVTGFKAKDAGEFTRYLKLLVDTELRRRMGEAARETVLMRHTTAQWTDHWRRAIGVENAVLETV